MAYQHMFFNKSISTALCFSIIMHQKDRFIQFFWAKYEHFHHVFYCKAFGVKKLFCIFINDLSLRLLIFVSLQRCHCNQSILWLRDFQSNDKTCLNYFLKWLAYFLICSCYSSDRSSDTLFTYLHLLDCCSEFNEVLAWI